MTQFPAVNINGTSKDALYNQYLDSHRKLTAAIESLMQGAPHGRDYQTLPAGSYEQARSEHFARLSKLASVQAEIEEIVTHLLDLT